MRYKQNAVLSSLRRAQQFFDDNSSGLSALNPTARAELDDIVAQLTTLSITQESSKRGSKGETARNRSLCLALRQDHIAPITEVARYRLQAVPEFAALTRPVCELGAQSLAASALAMADAAAAHAQVFIDSGLATTFIEDLRVAAKAVVDSIVERDTHQARRNGATAGLAALERRGRAMLRILNALILAQIRGDAQLRREWTTAKAVHRKPGPAVGAQSVGSTEGQRAEGSVVIAALGPVASPVGATPPSGSAAA
jgi:hypothetical protein